MHMDTDWLEVTRYTSLDNSRRDYSLQILKIEKTDEPFAFSCLPYTAEEIENATHYEELPPARRTVLCVCGAVRGVGGIAAGEVTWRKHTASMQKMLFPIPLPSAKPPTQPEK